MANTKSRHKRDGFCDQVRRWESRTIALFAFISLVLSMVTVLAQKAGDLVVRLVPPTSSVLVKRSEFEPIPQAALVRDGGCSCHKQLEFRTYNVARSDADAGVTPFSSVPFVRMALPDSEILWQGCRWMNRSGCADRNQAKQAPAEGATSLSQQSGSRRKHHEETEFPEWAFVPQSRQNRIVLPFPPDSRNSSSIGDGFELTISTLTFVFPRPSPPVSTIESAK